ncbi:bifunctional metallophosphatase/5'-nucleotidase [Secundilactobacillus folii]|uniref:Bifunctional metallophosphatase/5'-nucleotidase n=1 Tax=Secundilactobacillus folii TaxID=2678357 RepID=A0A7X2XYB0_9LACO|nr:bifunctional metallophosphatase/5'-nucleotidase [Secundilactobacillus folii]MTV83290.1 bifunctional metallophosphatase/5'-nucleotidase [Secundilactobacillus folii]
MLTLTILSTSDTHGFIFPTNYVKPRAHMPFGLIRAATVLAAEQQTAPGPVITIDDGDFLAGSPLAYYVAQVQSPPDPLPLTRIYNQIHYDAAVLGNHEFDYGTAYLERALNASDRPIVNANLLDGDNRPLFGQRYRIMERDGVKIAILGLTTRAVMQWKNHSNVTEDVHFHTAVSIAKEMVPKLKKIADIVIVCYHGGFERSLRTGKLIESLSNGENEAYQLLKEVKGIDALITGHQHRKIATTLFDVPVTQPGYRGEAIGKITLHLTPAAEGGYIVHDSNARLVETKDAQFDERIAVQSHELDKTVDHWLAEPLAKIDGDLTVKSPQKSRMDESAYTEFIQRVQMTTMQADISATSLFNNEGHGFENPITMRNIMTNYVYPDGLALELVTGKELKAALEKAASYFTIDSDGQITVNPAFYSPKLRHYNYDMYEGIIYRINVAKPVGKRIDQLTYRGQPVTNTQTFKLVLNRYRAGGGGHYDMFRADKIIAENKTPMSQIIADYLRAHPVIKARVNHNFKVVNEP